MKSVFGLCCVLLFIHCKTVFAMPHIDAHGARRCVNMWDEGCINGQLPGAGNDDDYLNGGFNPGKRCLNVWDEGCNNGPMASEGINDNHAEDALGRRVLYELLQKLRKKHQLY